ncbi:hypothetical protein F5887DRAFT_1076393 [Amanita rubescens]|nr:hypothetical protein F5887DRAFT_1076393 [Amanita rubescens]
MHKYRIQSAQTGHYIVSTGAEKPGDKVITPPVFDPHVSIVTIEPAVQGATSQATVIGKNGLHIAIHKAEEGQHLIWSNQKYIWDFATNGPPGTHSVYVNGKDLYWFDKKLPGNIIILEPGKHAIENEIFFKLHRLP